MSAAAAGVQLYARKPAKGVFNVRILSFLFDRKFILFGRCF